MKQLRFLLALIACPLAGCVVDAGPYQVQYYGPSGLTSEEILRMSKAGISDAVIIEKITDDGVAAQPTSAQAESLKKEGVSDAVVAALQAARVAVRREVVYTGPSGYYPYSYYYGPSWYGAPYWGWPHRYPYPYYGYYGGYYGGSYGRYYPTHAHSVHMYRR